MLERICNQKEVTINPLVCTYDTSVAEGQPWPSVAGEPLQLQELAALCGGYEGARLVHFFAMAAIVLFSAIHVVMALLVPRSLRAIITGR